MDAITMTAASGMRSRMESLDMLANNLANASAPGFKADREFYGEYLSAEADDSPAGTDPAIAPVLEKNWTDFAPGSFTWTGNPLDLAISSEGFLAVNGPNGKLYTRNGSLKLSTQGILTTQDGYTVPNQLDGQPIQLDPGLPVEVDADGNVVQGGQQLGRIDVVSFKDPHALSKAGQNYFKLSVSDPAPMPAASPQIEQGKLESANFQTAESAVRLVSVMRQFEAFQRAMAVGAEMSKKSIEEVAKVS